MSKIRVYRSAVRKDNICAGCDDGEAYIRMSNRGLEVIASGTGKYISSSWIIGVDLI